VISVTGSRELQAAVFAMKAADRELKSDINKATRATMSPVWKSLVELHATYRRDTAVIAKGARINAGNPPTAVAAKSNRALRGGLIPSESWQAIEFGGNRNKGSTYTRTSPKGKRHRVTRHTARGLPPRYRNGRVAYQAVGDIGPRLASLWVQLIIRKYAEAAEKAGKA